jgi:hypothetical protein
MKSISRTSQLLFQTSEICYEIIINRNEILVKKEIYS